MVANPLVDALIVAAEKDDVSFQRQFVCDALGQNLAVGGHIDDFVIFPFCPQFLNHPENRLHHHHHPRVRPVVVVVNPLVRAETIFPDVVDAYLHNPFLSRASHNRVAQRAVKELRDDGKYVNSHIFSTFLEYSHGKFSVFYSIINIFASWTRPYAKTGHVHSVINLILQIMSEEIIPEVNVSDVVPEVQENAAAEQPVPENSAEKNVENSAEGNIETPAEGKVENSAEENAEKSADVETAEAEVTPEAETPDYQNMSLAELVSTLQKTVTSDMKMALSKNVETIKTAFYKKLSKEKADAMQKLAEMADTALDAVESPFAAIEEGFKSVYNDYKKERAEFNEKQEKEREHNLELKQKVIDDLKELLDKQEDVNATFPAFREIQNRWREIGPVPATAFRNLNETYQLYVERFYDMVQINRELRDLDFKKNLEVKEKFCEAAEKLAENENVVEAFKELQKLHEQWKEYGPVAKEYRDDIWNRFKAATSVINKKYQGFYEDIKKQQEENLAAKTALCEKVEEIAKREVNGSNEWTAFSKEIEEIQQEWRKIGFASKKENQKIYDRFRAACDAFYARKREFYSEIKDSLNANLEKKISLCEAAEALKTSTEWKKASDQFIALQKQWKEIGAVPRKKSEQIWKRFRGACDEFFAERDKNVKPENDFRGNLKAKQAIIREIEEYQSVDAATDAKAQADFHQKWQAIGFVPFKDKDRINDAYRAAMKAKFGSEPTAERRGGRSGKPQRSEKEILIDKFTKLQQDIATYENNIGFFSTGKNSGALVDQMRKRIDDAKVELAKLAERIRTLDTTQE